MTLASSLRERWPLPAAPELRDALLAAWDRDGYHDQRHLTEVLDRLALLEESVEAVLLAAWFHDAVHDGAPDDEERSALWALQALPADVAPEVARLVRITLEHDPDPDDPAGCALSDADLGILGAPAGRYREYADDVRREYASVPDDAFRAGRAEILSELAARPFIFRLERARALWESAARDNLAWELEALRAG